MAGGADAPRRGMPGGMVEIRDRAETRGGEGGGRGVTSGGGGGAGGTIGGGGSDIMLRRGGRGVSISLGSPKSCGMGGKGTDRDAPAVAKAPRGGMTEASSPDEVPT